MGGWGAKAGGSGPLLLGCGADSPSHTTRNPPHLTPPHPTPQPQVGDVVMYMSQGHQAYLQEFPEVCECPREIKM